MLIRETVSHDLFYTVPLSDWNPGHRNGKISKPVEESTERKCEYSFMYPQKLSYPMERHIWQSLSMQQPVNRQDWAAPPSRLPLTVVHASWEDEAQWWCSSTLNPRDPGLCTFCHKQQVPTSGSDCSVAHTPAENKSALLNINRFRFWFLDVSYLSFQRKQATVNLELN